MQYIICVFLSASLLTACSLSLQNNDSESVGVPTSLASVKLGNPVVVEEHLQVPWAIAILPSGDLLITERAGTLLRLHTESHKRYPVKGVSHIGEGGLLGIALDPDFAQNRFLYLYFTTKKENGDIENRVERYRYENDMLENRRKILTDIPGAVYHDGGALAFGPDGYLYITTGDAGNEQAAQDKDSLAGKILRVTSEGQPAPGNPFGNTVYSYGHRNPQGITWDDGGNLWSTEHGRSGILSGYDELNLIKPGGNYGWPMYQGSQAASGIIAPVLHSGPNITWAPASIAYANGSIFFGGLRGEALYEVRFFGEDQKPMVSNHFPRKYGRIRAVVSDAKSALYITTSNTDGRGSPRNEDDLLLRVDLQKEN